MGLRTLRDVEVGGKRVLVRVDFNVPMENGRVTSTTRLRATLPTLRYLLEQKAKLLLCSHLGRPGGKRVESMSLKPVALELEQLLGQPVTFVEDCIGPSPQRAAQRLQAGEALMLENVRFHPGDEQNNPEFARELASLADLFVQDAFGVVHRAHASTVAVTAYLPAVAGFLLERELTMLGRVLDQPQRPLVAVLGGAKIKDKVEVVESLLHRVDALLIGGGMAATFFKAHNWEVGSSLVELEEVSFAGKVEAQAQAKGVRLLLPVDVVVAPVFDAHAPSQVVSPLKIPPGWFIMDVGPATLEAFRRELAQARTVFWNGPLGVFEMPAFSQSTRRLVDLLVQLTDAVTVVGGGSTAEAVESMGMEERLTHVSTGGGATLEYLAGRVLPGVAALGGGYALGKVEGAP